MKKSVVGSVFLFALIYICSCTKSAEILTVKERSRVRESVQLMTTSIAKDLSVEGPVAWLKYFENGPDFFMVSDGQLVFPNIDKADKFIKNTLVKTMPKIELRWSNIQIEAFTKNLASISAVFHEDITDSTGITTAHNGYFTAIAHQSIPGWKLHNLHWSSLTH